MGKFNFIKTDIPEVQIIEPTVFGDDRGYFMETYQIDDFAAESTMLLKQRSFFKVIEIFHCDPPKGNVKKEKSPESVRKSNRTIPASYYITLQPIL